MFRRQTQKLRFILAMIGMAGFIVGSGSLVNGAASAQSSTEEIEIRISNDEPSGSRVGSLAFRSARRPILVPISFAITDGKPQIQDDASAIVLEQLRKHPRRLITIEVEGLPIAFNLLPRSTRGKLLERGGADFPAKYDQFVTGELLSLLDAVRAEKPKSPLSIQGLPFDSGERIDSSSNQRFAPVISRLSAFVLDRGLVVSSRSDEQAVFARMFPNAIGMAEGRAVIYPLNLGWRLAIEGESLVAEEEVGDSVSDELDDLQATGKMAKARSTAPPVMSDLDDLGIAGRGGGRPMTNAASPRGRATGSSSAPLSSPGGNAAAAAPSGGSGGGGGSALPFGRNQQQGSAETEDVADDDAGEDPPADDDAGDSDDDWIPGDEVDEDPPADDDSDDSGNDSDPGADGAGDDSSEDDPPAGGGSDGDSPPESSIEWRTLSELQDIIDAAGSGDTIDLQGAYFGAGPIGVHGTVQSIREHGKALKIKNAVLSGTCELDWVRDSSRPELLVGAMESDLGFETVTGLTNVTPANPGDPLGYLVNFGEGVRPRLAVWPPPPENRREYPAAFSPNWIVIRGDGGDGVVNGIVETEAGPDVVGSRITGFQILDAGERQRISEALDGLDVTQLSLLYRAGANQVVNVRIASWNSASGRLSIVSEDKASKYTGYLQLAFTGSDRFITEEGQYVLDLDRKRVVVQLPGDGIDVRMAAVSNIWSAASSAELEFENVDFIGTNANSGAPCHFIKSPGGAGEKRAVFRDCRFEMGYHGVRGSVNLFECRFEQFRKYDATVTDGVIAERNFFGSCERAECLTVMCPSNQGDQLPVRRSVVRDNFFTNPITNHGQGLSLYSNSWQNAVVDHNLFLDFNRAFSLQAKPPYRVTPGSFEFINNLIVFDNPPEIRPNGQASIRYNGSTGDAHLDSRQIVIIASNTVAFNGLAVDPDVWNSPWNIDIQRIFKSTATVVNNFAGSINAPRNETGSLSHARANNLSCNPVYGAAWGETDLPTPSSYESVFDYAQLQPIGFAAYSASDGGPVGIRWANGLTIEDVRSIPDDWYERWPAMEIPMVVGTSSAWHGEDNR